MNALQLIENTYADISVETIHQHIEYTGYDVDDDDESVLGLTICWDEENEKLADLMGNEEHPKIGQKLNLMWIEKLKQKSNWKLGEKLYIEISKDCCWDGNFSCWFSKNIESVPWSDFIVEKNGYVSVRVFNHYTMDEDDEDEIKWSFMVRAESVYNDINYNLRKCARGRMVLKENR